MARLLMSRQGKSMMNESKARSDRTDGPERCPWGGHEGTSLQGIVCLGEWAELDTDQASTGTSLAQVRVCISPPVAHSAELVLG